MIILPHRRHMHIGRLCSRSLLVLVVLTIASCRKPDEDLGLDLLPGDPLGVVVDTFELHAFTFADTSVRTSGLSAQLLGSYMDPQFGLVKASTVAQLRLSAINIGLGDDNSGLVADSLVLALPFNGVNYGYGNYDAQTFQVFELDEDLSQDSSYRSDRIPQIINEDLVVAHNGRIVPRPLSSAIIVGDTLDPQLRIPLSLELAERFLDAFGTGDLANSDAFVDFFRGVYITVDNPDQQPFQGGILYFNLTSSAAKATLYYRDNNDQPDLTRTVDFPINSNSVRYTVMEHDPTHAIDPVLTMALQDSTAPSSTVHVQTLGGLRTAIRMTDLLELNDSEQILAKAELVVPVQGSYYPYYPPPATLFLFRQDSTGADVFLPDQLAGLGAIDGNYRESERAYHFNITRYVQRVLNGTYDNTGFEIVPGSGGVSANRVVLSGPAAAQDPMRLRLTFTTY